MKTKMTPGDGLNLDRLVQNASAYATEEELETIRRAIDTVTYEDLRTNGSQAFFDAFDTAVTPRTRTLLRGALYPNEVSPLRHMVNSGEIRMALTFAGQAQDYIQDLERLYQIPESRAVIDAGCDALLDEFNEGARLMGLHAAGIDARKWINEPLHRPDSAYLASSAVSQPLIFLTQMAQFVALGRIGLESDRIGEWCVAATGHSQGIVPAIIAAEGLSAQSLIKRTALVTRYMLWQGIEMQASFGPALLSGHAMAAITGFDIDTVETYLEDTSVCISLHNAFRRVVISGHPEEVETVLARIEMTYQRQMKVYEDGKCSRPAQPLVERLSVSAPFHSSLVAGCMPALRERMSQLDLVLNANQCKVPVVRYETGNQWRGECVIESQTINQVRWPTALKGLRKHQITHIIDAGPGAGVSAISALEVRGYGIGVIAVATQKGERTLLCAERIKASAPLAWDSYAPTLVTRGDGITVLENKFSLMTGYPPIFVPGMTPTTVEAPIISESANAGYLAELAGGGQTSEFIFRERAAELKERLKPGTGYLINTLYLDPYLWQLQIGKQRLVQKLRMEGHPILGVTISAGLPPKDEALSLLSEFNALGMHLNSLKVGSAEQIEHALDIADEHEGTLILQVEGGAAGGHHSFESLEDLLLAWYPRIRRRTNCLLTVGGGIGDGKRVAELLQGTWSERRGLPKMPVDAVYLGTALMACKEAATSDPVKKSLVDTKGTPKFVGRGMSVGGVRSGRSGLGADIHYVDNHAAKTSAFLDSVAGNADLVAQNRDKIIDMLAKTAKPYFGKPSEMTYMELLERLVELMAIGEGNRYQDGIWLDITHRQRFHRMLERSMNRCPSSKTIPELSELDAPRQLLKQLAKQLPELCDMRVLLEDQKFFINSVCSMPGKPVPFVPNIDENVRRWYCSDSLWQAHDARYDADSVLIIPGPNAVHGIEQADVPVAQMLSNFLDTTRATSTNKRTDTMPSLKNVALKAGELVTPYGVKTNPLPMIDESRMQHVELSETKSGVHLRIRHHLPLRGHRDLTVDFAVAPFEAKPLSVSEQMMTSLRHFYRKVMPQELAIDPDRIAAYRRITGDRGPATPEQFFFAVTLPKIMQRLLDDGLGLNPASLLHLSSEIHRRSFTNGGMYTAKIKNVRAEDGPGGRTVTVDCDVTASRTLIAQCQQKFLVREATGGIGPSFLGDPMVLTTAKQYEYDVSRRIFETEITAPLDLNAFSHISGDLNPIHRDPAVAMIAGLSGPIVHGQWTAATACGLLVGEDRRLLNSRSEFLGPVLPGEQLRFRGEVVALSEGHEVCLVTVENDHGPVLRLTATRECKPTALIFPGQGSQRKGMGMDMYAESPAAKDVWDRADRHTKAAYGFSILQVVRDNPKYLRVGSSVVEHPEGVLNVTQFTQVALTVLSVAGVADLRSKGVFPEHSWFCGHSVGEYSALCAVTNLFSLENLVDAVYHRGITMQEYVDRDAAGRSEFVMGVIRPNRIGMNGSAAIEMIEDIHATSGFPIYVVNHNVADRQYAVAGHLKAVDALLKKLAPIDPKGEGWVNIPGIDVPFHSPLLSAGVDAFRVVLEQCIPETVDIDRLVHRYVPNLVALPFELTDNFLDAMIEATGHLKLEALRPKLKMNGRAILIELLAWQFASPVRWIETQEYLNETVKRTIEVGPKAAPVLTNMFLSGYRNRRLNMECLHASRDAQQVLGAGVIESDEDASSKAPETSSAAATQVAPTTSNPPLTVSSAGPAIEDSAWDVTRALFALLALRLNTPMEKLGKTDTIDELLGGNSARRNQVLLDLGKEFGIGAIDGAHELGLEELGTQLSNAVGVKYSHPGPCLKAAQNEVLKALSTNRKAFISGLAQDWGLGPDRAESVLTTLAIHSDIQNSGSPRDAAVAQYAALEGVQIDRPVAESEGGSMVDAAAVSEIKSETKAHWKAIARAALRAAELDPSLIDRVETDNGPTTRSEAPVQSFNAQRYLAFTQGHQWVKADATNWFYAIGRGEYQSNQGWVRAATLETVRLLEALERRHPLNKKAASLLNRTQKAIKSGLKKPLPFENEVAIVTGAGPRSIAEAIVTRLLEGGATVIVSCSRLTEPRRAHFKSLFRQHAGRNSSLHVVPLNQGNLDDVSQFAQWVYNADFEVKGAERILIKAPWSPTLFFPFGAMPAEGDPTTLDQQIVDSLRVNLIGVEALVGQLAVQHRQAGLKNPICTVLPLSPNHGQMGRDGLYAEAKIGLEALMQRRAAEFERWGQDVMLMGARIGWVRGTGLMAALDRVYEKVEADLGIQTFSPTEMADLILDKLPKQPRIATMMSPDVYDFTGGFSEAVGLRETINRALELAARDTTPINESAQSSLPYYRHEFPNLGEAKQGKGNSRDLDDVICIVGFGEVGPMGNARIRWDYELNAKQMSLTAQLELAVWCGCIEFKNMEWVDRTSGESVDLAQLEELYQLSERVGIRLNEQFDPSKIVSFTEVVLSEDTTFHVPDAETATAYRNADPDFTVTFASEDGYTVVRKKGAKIRVPKIDPIDRNVAGQVPTGYDPVRFGVDAQSLEQIDPVAIYNLLSTADAFRSAGLTPEELWKNVHPARIACTQGSGIGGMRAQRRLYAESQLGENKQSDVLQETLINVTAAYAGMMYHGGYGAMINPVSACATAAISVEIASDLLAQNKADFVVAGAFDDFSREGARGFAEMQATIDAKTCEEKGIANARASRPCDVRRGGFVESQGGGTILMCRMKTALSMGLPIYGIVAGAWSGSDGIQRSVPAPGPGILRIGAGGEHSPLAKSLARLGLTPNDIGAVSLHGTSTLANDKNETQLHSNLSSAIGRDPNLPLMVIAQKAITGHAKGGAAAWQLNGLLQAMRDDVVPGMWNLDEPDPILNQTAPLVFNDENTHLPEGGLKAGLITSLGFGHVAGALCIAHPDTALTQLNARDRKRYLAKRNEREDIHRHWAESVLLGETPHFKARVERPFTPKQEHELLLKPSDTETA